MSVVVFTTGMGTTIAHFCCDSCLDDFFISQTISCKKENTVGHSSCCTQTHQPVTDLCNFHGNTDNSCCKIERHSIDLDSFHFKPIVLVPYTWIADALPQIANPSLSDDFNDIVVDHNNDPPPITKPRNYLSIIQILII